MNIKQRLRAVLGPIIIGATVFGFAYYLLHHPEAVRQIRQLPPVTVLVLVALYGVVFLALLLITRVSLRVYHKVMPQQENFLFNAYSSLINFFGPGQSGPAFRGVYLKKRHGLDYKKYLFITLIYYGFYAVISAFLMFVGSRPWWQTVLVMATAGAGSWYAIGRYQKRYKLGEATGLTPANIGFLVGATVLQLAAVTVIYGVELHNVGTNISLGQIVSYTGVANFALFVSLTPGAIGIREAFLVLSQQLHHIDSSTIVAANVIDRAVYLLFLGLLFVLIVSLHAKDKLRIKQLDLKE